MKLRLMLGILVMVSPCASAFPLKMVLEIASAIPVPQPKEQAAPKTALPSLELSWTEHTSQDVPCPDPASAFSPYGTPVVVSHTDGKDTIAAAGVAYPETKMCHEEADEFRVRAIRSEAEAEKIKASCAPGACRDFKIRKMAIEEVLGTGTVIVAACEPGQEINIEPGHYQAFADDQGVANVKVLAQAHGEEPYKVDGRSVNMEVLKNHAVTGVCQ